MTTLRPASSNWKLYNVLRSIAAGFLGIVTVVALSIVTDETFHRLDVYPPWGQPMNDTSDNLLALTYRCIYGVLGSYIAARLAPYAPMTHALALGYIGLIPSTMGAIVAMNMNLGPMWYPIGIVLTAVPCAWLGGMLHRKLHVGQQQNQDRRSSPS